MARASYDETPVSTCGTGKKAEDNSKQQQGKRYIGECVFTQPFALCSNLIDQSISICQQGVQVTLEFSEFIQTAECAV
ncbi:hypothetical protein T10_10652 [Trichinella papuae]|uniref:Uncharacterized protein n=1 Tax=Trichinella papuae TaxID=268474 RepID=A0A0V1MHT4_9BILA|nr:hypothetical protein T10_10652 [Trichinella papuae]